MNHQSNQSVQKYDIWLAGLLPAPESHVQSGMRPVVIVSNDVANTHSPIVISTEKAVTGFFDVVNNLAIIMLVGNCLIQQFFYFLKSLMACV